MESGGNIGAHGLPLERESAFREGCRKNKEEREGAQATRLFLEVSHGLQGLGCGPVSCNWSGYSGIRKNMCLNHESLGSHCLLSRFKILLLDMKDVLMLEKKRVKSCC